MENFERPVLFGSVVDGGASVLESNFSRDWNVVVAIKSFNAFGQRGPAIVYEKSVI